MPATPMPLFATAPIVPAAAEVAARVLGARDPVAGIRRVGVAAVTVVRDERVADEVVPGDEAAAEIDVWPVARVDHADRDPGRAGRQIPGAEQVDPVEAGGGSEHVPLGAPVLVARRYGEGLHQLVGLGQATSLRVSSRALIARTSSSDARLGSLRT